MRKTIISFIIIIFIVIFSTTISKAGVQIIKGATTYTSVNVSESFDICYNLRNGDSTLGTNTLDPHLATSLDWGAVAYLAQSRYGANATSTNSYNSTSTGNESGVKDTGGYMQTATLFENRNKTSTNAKSYRYRLEEALKTPGMEKYVDEIISVEDESIKEAMRLIAKNVKLIVEPASAICIGTLIEKKLKVREGEKVCSVLSGGNWDLEDLAAVYAEK